jgi:hypothetical protein
VAVEALDARNHGDGRAAGGRPASWRWRGGGRQLGAARGVSLVVVLGSTWSDCIATKLAGGDPRRMGLWSGLCVIGRLSSGVGVSDERSR